MRKKSNRLCAIIVSVVMSMYLFSGSSVTAREIGDVEDKNVADRFNWFAAFFIAAVRLLLIISPILPI